MHDFSDEPAVPWPPLQVRRVTDEFLSLVDEAAPGLVEGLYLHGSLGFGEWYDGRSDIDYVAVLAARPDAATVALLRDAHAAVTTTFPRPAYDGFHVTWDDLAGPPHACPDMPCTQAGHFHEEARLDVHPVTWHELAWHGVTVRGPRLEEVEIWTDQKALREYTRGNLASYWARQVEQLRRFPDEAGTPDAVAWYVLGTSRLHHLLATGRLTSKNGAGAHAVATFGERWRPLVAEALSIRAFGVPAGVYDDPRRRGQDVVAFSAMVVDSGLALQV